jgi:catechol 2,3-dioxygenase-like lactoylglutathione lyase family enzyme
VSSAKNDMKLEILVIPVSDVDRAKRFYGELGWRHDAEFSRGTDFRILQFTPPGSGCSIIFGRGVTSAAPGSAQGLYLVVSDIVAACAELRDRGVAVTGPFHDETGVFHQAGTKGRLDGPDPKRATYSSFAAFSDPDGNGWLLQEVTTRLPGRIAGDATTFSSVRDLAAAFRRAAVAHGEHEKRNGGKYDENWADWYAAYMVAEQSGADLPE